MVSPEVKEYGLKPLAILLVPPPFLLISAIALSLRIYVRGFMIKAFGWDDILLCAAFVSSIRSLGYHRL